MGSSQRFTVAEVAAPPATTVKSKAFSQACSKLSQFLKERRSFGDFGFTNSSKLETNGGKETCGLLNNSTMNLFPKIEEEKEENVSKGENFKSLNFFPLMSSKAAVNTEESTKNMAENSYHRELPTNGEPTTASMTIFYGGKVRVFNNLPEDKALEIMSFASQGTFNSPTPTPTPTLTPTLTPHKTAITTQSTQGTILQEQANLSDLPIARRVSLHRFMEKRKDRIAANAPYPLHNSSRGNYEKINLTRNSDQQPEQKLELNLFQ